MVGGMPGFPGKDQFQQLLQFLYSLPSPEKLMAELHQLNVNLEQIAPDVKRFVNKMDTFNRDDIQNLTAALNRINAGDMLRILNEFTALFKNIYTRLWGQK